MPIPKISASVSFPLVILMTGVLSLTACTNAPEKPTALPSPPAPPPVADLHFTPLNDQNADQQAMDRYACYLWASRQTGFDPSSPYLPPGERFEVTPSPAFTGTNADAADNAPNTPARRYRKAMSACLEGRGYSVR